MPKLTYRKCKGCGRFATPDAPLSHTRLCVECSRTRFADNLTQLREHRGPYFQNHRRACVAAFGGVLLDDLPPAP